MQSGEDASCWAPGLGWTVRGWRVATTHVPGDRRNCWMACGTVRSRLRPAPESALEGGQPSDAIARRTPPPGAASQPLRAGGSRAAAMTRKRNGLPCDQGFRRHVSGVGLGGQCVQAIAAECPVRDVVKQALSRNHSCFELTSKRTQGSFIVRDVGVLITVGVAQNFDRAVVAGTSFGNIPNVRVCSGHIG